MGTFTSSPHRGGADRYIAGSPAETSLENERDLGLAIRAKDKLLADIARLEADNRAIHPSMAAVLQVAKSIMWQLQGPGGMRYRRASPKQRAFLMKVLGIEILPPIASNVPAACRVLPLKPPGR